MRHELKTYLFQEMIKASVSTDSELTSYADFDSCSFRLFDALGNARGILFIVQHPLSWGSSCHCAQISPGGAKCRELVSVLGFLSEVSEQSVATFMKSVCNAGK